MQRCKALALVTIQVAEGKKDPSFGAAADFALLRNPSNFVRFGPFSKKSPARSRVAAFQELARDLPLNTACGKTQNELFLGGLATSTSVIVLLPLDSYPANR